MLLQFSSSLSFLALTAPLAAYSVSARVLRLSRAEDVPVSVPQFAPSDAPALDGNFISFSIEGDRWDEWVGTSEVNHFFKNILHTMGSLTGQYPDCRVGANSEDRTFYDPNVEVIETTFPAPTAQTPYPEADSDVVGDGYYALASKLPNGTHVTFGVNFLSGNVTNAVAMAKSILNVFSPRGVAHQAGVILDAIEIGNEVDLYPLKGNRPSSYNISSYIPEWESFAEQIIEHTNLDPFIAPRILLGGFAGGGVGGGFGGGFNPPSLFATGLLQSKYGQYVDTFSQHHYSGSVCSDAHGPASQITSFMDKLTIRGNISTFDADIQAVKSQGLNYIFGETNSISCHGAPGVSDSAAAALWMTEYSLQAGVRGVKQVFVHNGKGYKYNLVQPVHLDRSPDDNSPTSLDPHVQPQFYGAILVGKLLGNSTSRSRIAEISIGSNSTPANTGASRYVTGYAAYEDGLLSRALFLNLRPYLSTTTEPRGSYNLDVTVPTSGGYGSLPVPSGYCARRLKIGFADDKSGLEFGGISYETGYGLPSGEDTPECAAYGTPLEISDTEAVLVTFQF